MNNFLQILFLNPTDKNNIPVALLYLLIFVGVVFVIIKLANDNYLRQILSRVGLDRKKFDNQTSNYSFSKSNLFLQISSIILVTLGLSILTNEYLGSFNLAQNFIGAFLFYIIQVLSFTLFSSLIINTESSFLKHRLSY
ncbi:MAG: putative membrane protein [Flavobacteriales bacterium]